MRTWQLGLGIAGVLVLGYGLVRLITEIPFGSLAALVLWLIAAVVVHDGVLSPLLLAAGAALARMPARARRFVQVALVLAAPATVIAIPLILRRGSQPDSKAILQQNYGAHLALLWTAIAGVVVVAYLARLARDRSAASSPTRVQQRLQEQGEDDLAGQRPLPPPRREQGDAEQ